MNRRRKRVRLLPYRRGSKSARDIAQSLGILRLNLVHTRFRGRESDVILNWGSSTYPEWGSAGRWINKPEAVATSRNKIRTFQKLQTLEVDTVPWTTDEGQANQWLSAGRRVYCRRSVEGQGGSGITVVEPGHPLVRAPLYTCGRLWQHEFRVHVVGELVIDVSKKRRREGVLPHAIRNSANGYVFCRNNVIVPNAVRAEAVGAIEAVGLDFGAVDILANNNGEAAVLEVNSAPGVEGTTLERYTEALRRLI